MIKFNIDLAQWGERPIPDMGDSFECAESPTGSAIVMERVDIFDYEADLNGDDKLRSVRLVCAF